MDGIQGWTKEEVETSVPDELRQDRTHALISLEARYNVCNYRPLDVVLERAQGVWIWDVEGRRYLDCLSAYSAVNQGHAHPRIRQALVEQSAMLPLTSRAFHNDQLPAFAQEVCELSGYEMILPMNTGVEAVETALKVARKWGYEAKGVREGKAEIIVCEGNFHGRSITVISFSTVPEYRRNFGPYTGGFRVVPFGDAAALASAINENTVGFLVEPIQGEGGVVVPPDGYLADVRKICDQAGILFMADEIQTGLGRTGRLFACDWEGVRPDVMILGKALSGGFYPVSAVLASRRVLSVIHPGEHGSTFGGNPLACAVARSALRVIVEEDLVSRSASMGAYFLQGLRGIQSAHIKDIRGRGLLIGVELHQCAGGARRFCESLMERGLLCKETRTHVIRLAPPLVISRQEIDWALARIAEVIGTD
jgi:ornithine--oxo-acid transaminase